MTPFRSSLWTCLTLISVWFEDKDKEIVVMTCVMSKAYVRWQWHCMRMSKNMTRSLTEEQRLMRIITLQLSFILNLSTMWTVKGRKPDGDIYLDFRSFNNCAQQIQHPLVGYFNDMSIENRIESQWAWGYHVALVHSFKRKINLKALWLSIVTECKAGDGESLKVCSSSNHKDLKS